jgi:hypothetical protein
MGGRGTGNIYGQTLNLKPITIKKKKYLKAKRKNYENSNYISPCRDIIFKKIIPKKKNLNQKSFQNIIFQNKFSYKK